MCVRNWIALLTVATLVWLGFGGSSASLKFNNLEHAKLELEAAGFYCISDRIDGKVEMGGFLVSRDKLSWETVNSICKIGHMGPEWQSLAWVTIADSAFAELYTVPDGADIRNWGNIYIVGQRAFVDDVEIALREQRRN